MPTTNGKPAKKTTPAPAQLKEDDSQRNEIHSEFKKLVNMSSGEIEKWLKTEESKSVGQDSGDGTSIGAKSGARIAKLLGKDKAKLITADLEHMKKVTGYISRHLAQGPTKSDEETSPWRYSLMNWGHDPLKK